MRQYENQTQTEMATGLPHKIWRSRMSFQNQVYLDTRDEQLKSFKSAGGIAIQAALSGEQSGKNTQAEDKKIEELKQEHRDREKKMLESYENKQKMILANLEQIQKLE